MHVHFLSVNRLFCEVLLSQICVPAWLQTPASCNPPASTSGEILPTSQVFSERAGSRGFVGALLSIEPRVFPCANKWFSLPGPETVISRN
jgi:hypothetical protein